MVTGGELSGVRHQGEISGVRVEWSVTALFYSCWC